MSVNKRGNRGREDALRYGSVAFQILPLNCMRRMFYPALTVCAVRLSPHPNVSLNVSLYVSIGLWPRPTRTKKNYINECAVCWMCFTIVPDSLCIHTHLNVAVVRCFFWYSLILSSNVHSCVLDVRPVRFLFFFFFWRVVQFNKVLNVTVKVRSKLWPGWRDFSSLGGVFTTTICHLPNTRLHRPPLCVSKLKVFLNMSVLINAWSH